MEKENVKADNPADEKKQKEILSAPLNKRYLAVFIDGLLLIGIIVVCQKLFEHFEIESVTIKLLPYLVIALYEPLLVAYGATIGQVFMNVRVRKNENEEKKISLPLSYVRYLVKLLIGWVSFLAMMFSSRQRAFHDFASGSIVVQSEVEAKDMKLIALFMNKYFKFGFMGSLYVLWTIWVGKWWLIFGLGIIFDIYVTKKVNWSFWKKREGKNHVIIEWIDALIFAVIAVTFINTFFFQNYKIPTGSMEQSLMIGDHLYVSKVAYGPKIPHTPLSLPFVNNTLPGTEGKRESYLTWVKWPYMRLKGLTEIKRDDPVVFNFPAQDTTIRQKTAQSYYAIVRYKAHEMFGNFETGYPPTDDKVLSRARQKIWQQEGEDYIIHRPIDKKDNYIKRCVAIPGDTLTIVNGQIYINGKKQKDITGIQFLYHVETDGSIISKRTLERLGIGRSNFPNPQKYDTRIAPMKVFLTDKAAEKLKSINIITKIERLIDPPGQFDFSVFPHDPRYPWNKDNFGPLWLPKKGVTIDLNLDNINFYRRVIDVYEDPENVTTVTIKDSVIYINGEVANQYTFKYDYYWMMGDSRHNSLDSRFWGFVPEDHIVGRPRFIWLSIDRNNDGFGIRWKRMFMGIH